MSAGICPGDTQHGFCAEDRVGHIAIETHEDAFHRLEIRGIEHIAGHLQSVYLVACREGIGVIAKGIVLRIIGNGITEVDGIRHIGLQGVLELHHQTLAFHRDVRHLLLGRRDDDVVRSICHLDIFIEVDVDFLIGDMCGTVVGRAVQNTWRSFVIPSSVRCSHSGTAHNSHDGQQYV